MEFAESNSTSDKSAFETFKTRKVRSHTPATPDGLWRPQLNFPPATNFGNQGNQRNNRNRRETIETSGVIKTIEWSARISAGTNKGSGNY